MDKASVHESLTRVRAFQSNWDGYGAAPLDRRILDTVASVINLIPVDAGPTPQVVPMTRGRVQLEWHRGTRSLELEFQAAGSIHFLKWDSSEGIEEEDVVDAGDAALIVALVCWFAPAN